MNIEEQKSIIREFMDNSKITVNVPFTYERGDTMPRTNEICTPETVYNEVVQDIDEGGFDHLHVEILDYDNSWELLMKVISKIRSVVSEPEDIDTLRDVVWDGSISTVFSEVVDTIDLINKGEIQIEE